MIRRRSKPPPALTDLETEIMEEIWDRQQATVREVLDALNAASDRERAYTTVMTIMNRLAVTKGVLRRRRGNTDVYRAALSREKYYEARAGVEVSALVEHFGDAALVHFARQMKQLDPERARQLRALADGE